MKYLDDAITTFEHAIASGAHPMEAHRTLHHCLDHGGPDGPRPNTELVTLLAADLILLQQNPPQVPHGAQMTCMRLWNYSARSVRLETPGVGLWPLEAQPAPPWTGMAAHAQFCQALAPIITREPANALECHGQLQAAPWLLLRSLQLWLEEAFPALMGSTPPHAAPLAGRFTSHLYPKALETVIQHLCHLSKTMQGVRTAGPMDEEMCELIQCAERVAAVFMSTVKLALLLGVPCDRTAQLAACEASALTDQLWEIHHLDREFEASHPALLN